MQNKLPYVKPAFAVHRLLPTHEEYRADFEALQILERAREAAFDEWKATGNPRTQIFAQLNRIVYYIGKRRMEMILARVEREK